MKLNNLSLIGVVGSSPECSFMIDRIEDIWLRRFCIEFDRFAPDGGYTGFSYWNFYWKGYFMMVTIELLESKADSNRNRRERKKIHSIDIPADIEAHRGQVLYDLKLALLAYTNAREISSGSYELTLEV